MTKYWIFFLVLLTFGCSSEKAAEGPRPQPVDAVSVSGNAQQPAAGAAKEYSLEIISTDATRKSIINLVPKGFNLADARIIWYLNGSPATGIVPNQVNQALIKKNDELQAKAVIHGKEMKSNTVKIKNSLPELSSANILLERVISGYTLSVEASGSDIDGDEVKIVYEWIKNGEPAGNSSRMEGSMRRGDNVTVKITPFDGESYGAFGLLRREIQNLPPLIIEDKNFTFDGKAYIYQVRASDPDGDALTYALKSAPQDMAIEPSTGLIKWNVPQNFTGEATASVSVSDGHGGEATYNIKVTIGAAEKK